MKRLLTMAAAALALAACGDASPTAVAAGHEGTVKPAESPRANTTSTQYTIFTTQTPGTSGDATPGWEVGTQFYVTQQGCVVGLRFWRAEGETGTNTIKLWDMSGNVRASRTITSTGSGWQYAYFSGFLCLQTYTFYRVSVNTNTRQVKSFGIFNGPVVNGPVVGTAGYYGQPTGSIPTTSTTSGFFVDVIYDTGFGFGT